MSAVELTRDVLARHVGSTLRVDGEAVTRLTITDVSAPRESGPFESFAIELTGPSEPRIDQRTYRLHHDELGTVELFVVPVGVDSFGAHYEVVFNRPRREGAGEGG